MSDEEIAAVGIKQNLIRIAVGLEDWRDLVDDLSL